MLSAATARLRPHPDRSSTADSVDNSPSSHLSPDARPNRRLSRITLSQFDSILSTHDTRHTSTSTTDETTLGLAPPDLPTSPDLHSSNRTNTSSTMLSPDPASPDALKRRSMFRSLGNASSPDLSSLLKKAKEASARLGPPSAEGDEQEVLDPTRQEAYEDADESAHTPSSPPRPSRARSTTSPSISRTSPRLPSSPPGSSSQLSVPSSADSTLASRPSSPSKPRLSAISTFSTGSYVHVPFPPATSQAQMDDYVFSGLNPSSTSLAAPLSAPPERGIGFDFSPQPQRRKKSNAGDDEEGKISLSRTMRKTSRFFRKFGGGSSTGTNGRPVTSAPTTPSDATFSPSSTAPPVPAIPSSYSTARNTVTFSPRRAQAASSATGTRNTSIDMHISPVLPRHPAPAKLSSHAIVRDDSQNSLQSQQSGFSAGSVATRTSTSSNRRRSMSLNSGIPSQMADPALTTVSKGRRPPASSKPGSREEDDRLKSELTQWRLGVDGVIEGGNSPNPDGSPRRSTYPLAPSSPQPGSPTLYRARTASPGRRPSLPENQALPPAPQGLPAYMSTAMQQRSASLPTSSLVPPPLSATSTSPLTLRGRPGSRGSLDETPSIRLVSPSRSSPSPSPISPPDTLFASSPSAMSPRPSMKQRSFSSDSDGVGLGLETIAEGSHSRDSSLATTSMTPIKTSTSWPVGAEEPVSSPTPTKPSNLQPPSASPAPPVTPNGSSTRSNQRATISRASIVGYPSSHSILSGSSRSHPPSAAASSVSLVPSVTSVRRPAGGKKKREEEDEVLPEEELQEKAKGFARRAWEEDEGFLERRKIAEWLGSAGRVNVAALRCYIDNFDFTGLRLDVAFRRLCGKLYLKAETQQVDRILEQFSRRYFEDNPRNVYGSADVVHAVSYSLLLLNTDLHVVDTTSRMTRQQFIRNTVEAIKSQTGDSSENVASPAIGGPALLFSPRPSAASSEGTDSAVFGSPEASLSRKSIERPRTAASVRTNSYKTSRESPSSSTTHLPASPVVSRTASGIDSPARLPSAATPIRSESLVTVNSTASAKSLEASLQATLKDMYNAIKSQPIYQTSGSGSGSNLHLPEGRPSLSLMPGNSPYATWSGGVNRSASRRSGANSSAASAGSVSSSYKRSSIRGVGAFLGASSSLDLARPSSPSPSTSTSLSDEHWSTAFGVASQHHAVPTIGFANSLSHTIIREQQEDDARSDSSSISVTSAELALLGAPWAKEGILHRKHYWETTGKRSKDKSWVQAFVVISNGELKMFRFDTGGGMRAGAGGLGGGDWTANASNAGSISLIHALCSAMPAPGYSRERPHCFVLTLPSGGSYFFQAGTPDLVAEWVATCNYWSARLSKEPLSGGVSNMEYGWNRAEPVEGDDYDDFEEIASIRSGHSRVSHASSAFHSYSSGGSNSNDRILINEWKVPQVPLTPSNLPEEVQLDALKKHIGVVEAELAHHNVLRSPMIRLYSNRATNGNKALANWERKSQHLLTESVKWTTYIDALTSAIRLRSLQRGKKEVEAMLESADVDEEEQDDDDELAASLSPFEQPPSAVSSHEPSPVDDDENGAHKRQSRYDSAASQVSVTTSHTADEYFES
ncbi:hypothetical protein JCM11641_004297 [Rhodosporidiobolus odoratus]